MAALDYAATSCRRPRSWALNGCTPGSSRPVARVHLARRCGTGIHRLGGADWDYGGRTYRREVLVQVSGRMREEDNGAKYVLPHATAAHALRNCGSSCAGRMGRSAVAAVHVDSALQRRAAEPRCGVQDDGSPVGGALLQRGGRVTQRAGDVRPLYVWPDRGKSPKRRLLEVSNHSR